MQRAERMIPQGVHDSRIQLVDKKPYVKPTKRAIQAAWGKNLPDVIAPGLGVLFCGINPGLYSAAVSCHFARPGNRFWKALNGSGFTPRRLEPWEQKVLIDYGCGLTNLVDRATTSAKDLDVEDLVIGRRRLIQKVRRYEPRFVAILGLGAFRTAFQTKASLGPQPDVIGHSRLWVLPNPSGINASYQLPDLCRLFGELRSAAFP